jgi:NADH-quinone oxidoreductase subunit L
LENGAYVEPLLRWIVLLPLAGATVNGLLNRRIPRRIAGLLACASVGFSLVLALRVFWRLKELPAGERFLEDTLYTWIGFGNLRIDLAFAIDPLSAVMALVVTGVGFLIHVYSLGYMAHDAGSTRFFAYLNLFVFAMMTLVLGENLLVLFVGWEGVGLCSYLLISFWWDDVANAAAGKKAFVFNRVGDFGFLLGMFLIGATMLPHLHAGEGVLSFRTLAANAPLLAPVATAVGLLLFLGATGKSAQLPLYVWLPDAMAGPTPVSALIHAATMVTAGVYMLARMNFLYVLSPTAMAVVAAVGAATALFAATIAIAQNDIKKVLAYSTVSQLGYMVLACGVGAFGAGIFHVTTHAFFKALLFLGAGSVIHAMSNEQDVRVMGGLRGKLPITFATFLIATLAIAGVFPLAGFFSKDEILWRTFSGPQGGIALWIVGFLAAGLTAFYMMRLVVLTFFGSNRASEEVRRHIHESPATMTAPLVILALLSIIGGWIGWPQFLGGSNPFEHWLEPVFHSTAAAGHGLASATTTGVDAVDATVQAIRTGHAGAEAVHETVLEWTLASASLLWSLLGLLAGYWVYGKRAQLADGFRKLGGGAVYRVLLNKYYVDEAYEAAFVRPGWRLSNRVLWRWIDVGLIDGLLVNGSAFFVAVTGSLLRLLQNGLVRFYAYVFAVGVTVFLLYLTFSG